MQGLNFIAIDFETATGKRASVCEAGICVVKDGKVVETKSWLVKPEDNAYSYYNIQIHGIRPEDTWDAPEFPEVWEEIMDYLDETPVLVAHNAAFDISCIDYLCAQFEIPEGKHHRAGDDAEMCARLFLKEVRDAGWCELSEMNYCNGKL